MVWLLSLLIYFPIKTEFGFKMGLKTKENGNQGVLESSLRPLLSPHHRRALQALSG
jgi:hypothetical protein